MEPSDIILKDKEIESIPELGALPKDKETDSPLIAKDLLDTELLNVDDIMGRALCPYFLLGNTAESVLNDRLDGSKIEVGTYAKNVTKEVMDTFSDWIRAKDVIIDSDGFSYISHTGVPVECKFVKDSYPFFDNTSVNFYGVADYYIPNPFASYWVMRDKII